MIDTVAIKQSVDLVGLIESDRGPGVKRGNHLFWRCPFHDDRNPSLTVYHDHDGDRYHCHGCGARGDVFDWQQHRQGVSFQQAVAQWKGQATSRHPSPYRSRHPSPSSVHHPKTGRRQP